MHVFVFVIILFEKDNKLFNPLKIVTILAYFVHFKDVAIC